MSSFFKSEQIDKSPHKTSVSKKKQTQTQDTETSFETLPKLLLAQKL